MSEQPLSDAVRAFASKVKTCAVGTTRPDGSVRQSVTYFALDGDKILISTVADRAKARDVTRTGRASVCVFGHEKPFPSVTLEGPARIVAEKAQAGELTRRISSMVFGIDPATAPSDDDIAKAGRVVLEITAERVYGASYVPEA